MMRIVSVCRSYGTGGGMENVVHDRAVALRALGHEVFVVHAEDHRYSDTFARLCIERCDALKPELIHLDSYDGARPWWVDRPERVALTLHGNPWSYFFTKWNLWMHAGGKEPGMSYSATRRALECIRKADVVIVISEYERGLLCDTCGVDVRTVYNPIAPYFFDTPQAEWPQGGYFLSVGGSTKRRGFDLARAAAATIGVEWRHATTVPREEMVEVYDGCRALVLPTFRTDGFDLVVHEALARGRPAIISRLGAYRSEAEGAILVPPGDVEALCEAMRRCQPPLAKARMRARLRHLPARHARTWLEAVA